MKYGDTNKKRFLVHVDWRGEITLIAEEKRNRKVK
jgi:hypothetical protein